MGFPFVEILKSVLATAPTVIWDTGAGLRFVFFWFMVFFVGNQYTRTAKLQAQLYGKPRRNPLSLTLLAAVEGFAVGVAGSYLMTFVGVSFTADGGGLVFVMLTAVALMLVNPRFMCFSYAGGLVSLGYLIFGWPKVSVPALMGLVAILHLMESLLIFLNGSAAATPVYLEQKGRQVGAFYLQRAWPVPLALLILAVLSPTEAAAGVSMPDWWPLLRTSPEILANPGAIFFLYALPAALGYSDLAVTGPPRAKTRRTSLHLAIYSLALLGLSVAATYWTPLVWVVALFGPLAHEGVVRLGNRLEMGGEPYFVPSGTGLMVLDVVPGSPAARNGLGPGWVVTHVNGEAVRGREEFEDALDRAGQAGELRLEVEPPAFGRGRGRAGWRSGRQTDGARAAAARRVRMRFGPGDVLGVIPVPEPGDDMGLVLTSGSPVVQAAKGLAKGFRRLRKK